MPQLSVTFHLFMDRKKYYMRYNNKRKIDGIYNLETEAEALLVRISRVVHSEEGNLPISNLTRSTLSPSSCPRLFLSLLSSSPFLGFANLCRCW